MARGWIINGPSLVYAKFGAHLSGIGEGGNTSGSNLVGPTVAEIGLSSEQIVLTPLIYHQDIHVDALAQEAAAETLWKYGEFLIRVPFVHYADQILETCLVESMGGGMVGRFSPSTFPAIPAGVPLGNGLAVGTSGNHYYSLNFTAPNNLLRGWHFQACMLTGRPLEIPLSTQRSIAIATFRSIPYTCYTAVPTQYQTSGGAFSGSVIPAGEPDPRSELTSVNLPIYTHSLDS